MSPCTAVFIAVSTFVALALASGASVSAGVARVRLPVSTQQHRLAERGSGTYYNGGGALGACGAPVNDQNAICALSPADFDASSPGGNPNANTLCGSCVTISYQGKTATCTVMDRCAGCSAGDIDMTPVVFQQLADPSLGRIPVTWSFCGSAPAPAPAPAAAPASAPAATSADPAPAPSVDPAPAPSVDPSLPAPNLSTDTNTGGFTGTSNGGCDPGCGTGVYWATGTCVQGTCKCIVGWTGPACQTPGWT